jgi:drug/metabolite transporter (DMT)-like permease
MTYLLMASVIWAFSFGLIKNQLTGLDANVVSFLRLFISFLVFVPFLSLKKLKIKHLNTSIVFHLLAVGAIQFGLMYATYIYSFQFLKAYEVALFTILTPIYVTFVNDLINRKGIDLVAALSAVLAVLGAGFIVYKRLGDDLFVTGVLLVQVSNICFAVGQIYYRNLMQKLPQVSHSEVFAIPFLGGALITLLFSFTTADWTTVVISSSQLFTIIYLGLIASGVGFFLWNKGTLLVKTSTLAVMNNVKIPLAVLCAIFIFGEGTNWIRLLIGGGIMLFSVIISDEEQMKKYKWWRKHNQPEV